MYCEHCGRKVNPTMRCLGNYARARGWSEQVIKQAARETKLDVRPGPTTRGNSPVDWIGVWGREEFYPKAFFKRARAIIKERQDYADYNRRRIAELEAKLKEYEWKGNVIAVRGEKEPETIGEMRADDVGYTMPSAYDQESNTLNTAYSFRKAANTVDTMFVRCIQSGQYEIEFGKSPDSSQI